MRARARVVRAGPNEIVLDVPGWPGHRSGQFAMLQLDPDLLRRDPLLPRPLALYRGKGSEIEFRFKVVGRGTRILSDLEQGAAVGIVGPLGNGFAPIDGRAVLVGGGTGVASLYELARECGSRAVVVLGGRSADDILGLDDFRDLPCELRIATEDGSLGHAGLVTDLLMDLAPGDTVCACGPHAMMHRVADLARDAGARCQVSLESPMACGVGLCLGCVVRTTGGLRYVCSHGPVFEAAEIVWEDGR